MRIAYLADHHLGWETLLSFCDSDLVDNDQKLRYSCGEVSESDRTELLTAEEIRVRSGPFLPSSLWQPLVGSAGGLLYDYYTIDREATCQIVPLTSDSFLLPTIHTWLVYNGWMFPDLRRKNWIGLVTEKSIGSYINIMAGAGIEYSQMPKERCTLTCIETQVQCDGKSYGFSGLNKTPLTVTIFNLRRRFFQVSAAKRLANNVLALELEWGFSPKRLEEQKVQFQKRWGNQLWQRKSG